MQQKLVHVRIPAGHPNAGDQLVAEVTDQGNGPRGGLYIIDVNHAKNVVLAQGVGAFTPTGFAIQVTAESDLGQAWDMEADGTVTVSQSAPGVVTVSYKLDEATDGGFQAPGVVSAE